MGIHRILNVVFMTSFAGRPGLFILRPMAINPIFDTITEEPEGIEINYRMNGIRRLNLNSSLYENRHSHILNLNAIVKNVHQFSTLQPGDLIETGW